MAKRFLTLNIGAATVELAEYEAGGKGALTHANLSNATEPGVDCDKKPYVWPLIVLAE